MTMDEARKAEVALEILRSAFRDEKIENSTDTGRKKLQKAVDEIMLLPHGFTREEVEELFRSLLPMRADSRQRALPFELPPENLQTS